MDKVQFLQVEFPRLLHTIDPGTKPAWGKMNLQQMIEHMSDSLRIANGRDAKDCVTPLEHLPRMQAFMMSEKPFKENTVNVQMAEEPMPCRWDSVDDAIGELEQELNEFVDVFEQDKSKVITNPFFGDLNFEQWVQLLTKHALHHLRQFGVVPSGIALSVQA
jgi:hypothetical protein